MRYHELHFEEALEVSSFDPPSKSGIYCIFGGKPGYGSLEKPIYIGKAEDINDRFDNHEKIEDWKEAAGPKTLYCSIAWLPRIGENELFEIEHEMIYRYQPIVNIYCKENPPKNRPKIYATGEIDWFPEVNPNYSQ